MSVDKRYQRKPKPTHPWLQGPHCKTERAEQVYRKLKNQGKENPNSFRKRIEDDGTMPAVREVNDKVG